jgi:hypothetical protein
LALLLEALSWQHSVVPFRTKWVVVETGAERDPAPAIPHFFNHAGFCGCGINPAGSRHAKYFEKNPVNAILPHSNIQVYVYCFIFYYESWTHLSYITIIRKYMTKDFMAI